MAAILARYTRTAITASRAFSISSRALAGGSAAVGDPKDNANGLGVTGTIPKELDQATGLERVELLEHLKGNDDPFGVKGLKVGPWGTKAAPRLIPSHNDARLVGCVCEPDAERIFWFEVKAGQESVCPCGQYFKLVKSEGLQ